MAVVGSGDGPAVFQRRVIPTPASPTLNPSVDLLALLGLPSPGPPVKRGPGQSGPHGESFWRQLRARQTKRWPSIIGCRLW